MYLKNLHKKIKKSNKKLIKNDAVTSLISLILILMIYFSSIGVIFLWGIPAIEEMKDRAQREASLNNFQILDSLVDDLVQSGPGSESSINIENTYQSGSMSIDSSGDRLVTYYTISDDYELDIEDIKEDEIIVDADHVTTGEIDIDNVDIYFDTCFLAGTKVLMADGSSKNIEDIKPGESVKSYDFEEDEFVDSMVSFHHVHKPCEMGDYYLVINGDLCVTPNHRFYTDGGWVSADNLKINDRLFCSSKTGFSSVKFINKVYEPVVTYDLSIKELDNYFVRLNNKFLLVHNSDILNLQAVEDIEMYQLEGVDSFYASFIKFNLAGLYELGDINILSAELGLYVTDKNSWDLEPVLLIKDGGEEWTESSDSRVIEEMIGRYNFEITGSFNGDVNNYWYSEDIREILIDDYENREPSCSLNINHPEFLLEHLDGISQGTNNKLSIGLFGGSPVNIKFSDRAGLRPAPVLKVTYEEQASNNPPVISNPSPNGVSNVGQNSSDGVDVNLWVKITDADDDPVTVNFYNADVSMATDPLIDSVYVENTASGRYVGCWWNNLNYDTEYSWYVTADDGKVTQPVNSSTWSFRTILNHPPNAVDDNPTVSEGCVNQSLNVLFNDDDIDGHNLFIISATNPPSGEGTILWDASDVKYTAGGFVGTTSFTYTISDGFGGTDTATVTVTVSSTNIAPDVPSDPIPDDGNLSAGVSDLNYVNVTLSVYVFDLDGDTLDVTFYVGNENGVYLSSPPIINTVNGVNSGTSASVTWTLLNHNQKYYWFTEVSDETETVSSPTWNFTTVDLNNNNPVAEDDSFVVPMNCVDYTMDVRSNDSDPDGHSIAITSVTQPLNGTTINYGSHINFNAETDFTGTTSFSYTISDGFGGTDTATVTVEVGEDLSDFIWYDTDGSGPGTIISFNAVTSGLSNYSWDFDYTPGTPANEDGWGENVFYDYGDTNVYWVNLTVDHQYSTSKQVYASISTISSTKPNCNYIDFFNGTDYTFTAQPGDSYGDRNYSWDFNGDKIADFKDSSTYSSGSQVAQATWNWTKAGIYFVRYKPNYESEGLISKWSNPLAAVVQEKYRSPEGFLNKISSRNSEILLTNTSSYKIEILTGDKLEGTVKIDLYNNAIPSGAPGEVPFACIWILDLGYISFSMSSRNGIFDSLYENNAILSGYSSDIKYISTDPEIKLDNNDLIFNLIQIRKGSTASSITGKGLFKFSVEVLENPINDAWSEDAKNIKVQIYGDNNQSWEQYLDDKCNFDFGTNPDYGNTLEYNGNPDRFQFFVSKIQIKLEGFS